MLLRAVFVAPIAVQAAAMALDELHFHRRRGLGLWERVGHPLDTLTLLACIAYAWCLPPTEPRIAGYVALAVFSCLFVTKDEWVHARECSGGEQWLHAVLFVVHPLTLGSLGLLWPALHASASGPARPLGPAFASTVVRLELGGALAFVVYQTLYWSRRAGGVARRGSDAPARVNNAFYDGLDERWYEADDHPIALLRAESACRVPWIMEEATRLCRVGDATALRVLDLGCGAGFLANALAAAGHEVTGIDASASSLRTASGRDGTRRVRYVAGDVRALPFAAASFDVVCAMDLLEHVERPAEVIAEAARVLSPGGCFFFHTFNRSWLSWLVVVKGVEWFVANTPRDLHVARLFLKPREVEAMCRASGLRVVALRGFEPVFASRAFVRLLRTRRVPRDFAFRFTRATRIGYTGIARKSGEATEYG